MYLRSIPVLSLLCITPGALSFSTSFANHTVASITCRDINFTQPPPGKVTHTGKLLPFPNGTVITSTDTSQHPFQPSDARYPWYITAHAEHTYSLTSAKDGEIQTLVAIAIASGGAVVKAVNASATPSTGDIDNMFNIIAVEAEQIGPVGMIASYYTHANVPYLRHICISNTTRCLKCGPDGQITIAPPFNSSAAIPKNHQWNFDIFSIPPGRNDGETAATVLGDEKTYDPNFNKEAAEEAGKQNITSMQNRNST
ncbi:hypothetical protein C8R43DRAFT_964706 [Mycena crocata]|nr:hypothetical protein C8R43DRAFT_964706 [Mycena crocata]